MPKFYKNQLTYQARSSAFAEDLSVTFLSVLLNVLFEKLAQLLSDWIFKNIQVRASKEALLKSRNTLKKQEKLYFGEEVSFSLDGISANIDSILTWLYGQNSRGKTCSVLLLGPPGVGKTSIVRRFYQDICKKVVEYSQKPINNSLSDSEIKAVLQSRKMVLNSKEPIEAIFIPGSFFSAYGEYKSAAFNNFIDLVIQWLRDGKVVFIGIDEIDALIFQKTHRGDLGTEFIFGLDKIQRIIEYENLPGRLLLFTTSNGMEKFDMAMTRRISQEDHVLNFPSLEAQRILFTEKLLFYLNIELKIKDQNLSRVSFNKDMVIANINKNLPVFIKNGVNFTGASVENVMKNLFGRLFGFNDQQIKKYGKTIDEQVVNIIKILMLNEAFKMLKLQQNKFSATVKTILDSIFDEIEVPKHIPRIEAGSDWNIVASA